MSPACVSLNLRVNQTARAAHTGNVDSTNFHLFNRTTNRCESGVSEIRWDKKILSATRHRQLQLSPGHKAAQPVSLLSAMLRSYHNATVA